MAEHFGIEAARAALMNEITGVFGAYGISVDHRHVGLVADYMTHSGEYRAFNRRTLSPSASPLQQMSFETTVGFLSTAATRSKVDPARAPSARMVLGRLVPVGSGLCDVLPDVREAITKRQPTALSAFSAMRKRAEENVPIAMEITEAEPSVDSDMTRTDLIEILKEKECFEDVRALVRQARKTGKMEKFLKKVRKHVAEDLVSHMACMFKEESHIEELNTLLKK
eukprot:Plantae.Rhodophyta-Palmaria_palmata.ctg9268.p1 GENE.Plantae.Rhodophyta-Palmaria_palmata.ctg9268~~Plantae.Rhodophyta-Palmaria_palmata.ctg9268.p1  ORF type:complete len:261 (+),score=50.56 Plantae.Rhodophyta-Palmaria_palmata.ctg9268:109-783(+)